MCPFKFLGFKSNWLDLRTFVVNSAFTLLRAFWGALLAKTLWRGAQKQFNGPGCTVLVQECSAHKSWNISGLSFIRANCCGVNEAAKQIGNGRWLPNRKEPENGWALGLSEKNRSDPPDWHTGGTNQFCFAGSALHQLPNSQPTKNDNDLVKHWHTQTDRI